MIDVFIAATEYTLAISAIYMLCIGVSQKNPLAFNLLSCMNECLDDAFVCNNNYDELSLHRFCAHGISYVISDIFFLKRSLYMQKMLNSINYYCMLLLNHNFG